MKTLILKLATVALIAAGMMNCPGPLLAQESKPEAQSAQLVEIVLRLNQETGAARLLRKLQADIISIAGVRSVGVHFNSREMVIRYLGTRRVDESLFAAVRAIAPEGSWQVVTPRLRQPERAAETTEYHPTAKVVDADTSFTCLHYEQANELCPEHLREGVLDSLDLRQCYVIKVDFKTGVWPDGPVDWLSQSRLEAKDGELVKPLAWLHLPEDKTITSVVPASGLLIFPKIPALNFGVTLRLLRATGDGYDSFNLELAAKPE